MMTGAVKSITKHHTTTTTCLVGAYYQGHRIGIPTDDACGKIGNPFSDEMRF